MKTEREVFDEWYGVKPKGWFEAIRYNTAWKAWQAAKAESHKQAALYQFEINHLAQANEQWREKAANAQAMLETQQAVIDELKAQLKAVHDSRVEFVEYCRMVEAQENKR